MADDEPASPTGKLRDLSKMSRTQLLREIKRMRGELRRREAVARYDIHRKTVTVKQH